MATILTTRKTSVEIDSELFAEVRRVLSTATLRETIDEAFRQILRFQARREEIAALTSMTGMDLDNETVMAGAWRS